MNWCVLRGRAIGVFFSLFCATWSAFATEPFFYVSVIQDDTESLRRRLIVRPYVSRTYQNLGVRMLDSSFAFNSNASGDCLLASNGWCLFSGNRDSSKAFNLVRRASVVASKEKAKFQLALNAKGTTPISVQTYETETVQPGRIIGYVPGWLEEPAAKDVALAKYTHVLIAFGLFSTTSPGVINVDAVSAFDLADYVAALQAEGIKVLLSIGGASTGIPDTTVSFDQAVSLAATPKDFINNFIASMENLVSTYGFDGFDFDIEQGLNEANSFTNPAEGCNDTTYNPRCNIRDLAEIINGYYTSHSDNRLLTLAPQLANVAATPSFSPIWGNYASLVMETYSSLEWVGFQIYNSGCVFGIDRNCYPLEGTSLTSSPDSAAAVAVDLLENWPEKTETGVVTGFQPYKSYLKDSQVVLGYAVLNGAGNSDGSPPAVVPVVNDAIECLRTGRQCDSYVPPNTYPSIGGVFGWTINADASNNYAFSTGVYPCVVQGDCSNVSIALRRR
ncbi:MAG: glycosyl hydrolase family 18 protein [Legionellaceae bacterium]|nr:glycosyl hydrolase family 18 protein [Legionellaceae bacterium]